MPVGHDDRAPKQATPTATHDAEPPTQDHATSPNPVDDRVITQWLVNYDTKIGAGKDLSRRGDDQLIIDELRIAPNGESPQLFSGGNLARSGRVHIARADVKKGKGAASASVRYGTQRQLRVHVTLEGKPSNEERLKAKQLAQTCTREALQLGATEGNYETIATALEQKHQVEFDVPLHIRLVQDASANKLTPYSTKAADYEANAPSEFEVQVFPHDVHEHTTTFEQDRAVEAGANETDEQGSKVSTDISTNRKESRADEMVHKITHAITQNTRHGFKKLEEWVNKNLETTATNKSETVTWHAGLGPANKTSGDKPSGDKPGTEDGAKDDGGLLKQGWEIVKSAPKWLYRKATDKLKAFPIASAGFQLVSDAWDAFSGTFSISRDSTNNDTGGSTSSKAHDVTSRRETDNLEELADTLSDDMTRVRKDEIVSIVETRVGSEVTTGLKKGRTTSTKTNTKFTTSSTITEARSPAISIKKLG